MFETRLTFILFGVALGVLGFGILAFTSWRSPSARQQGVRAHWARGWLVNSVGMSMIGISWVLLAFMRPRLDWPILFWLGIPVALAGGVLFLLGARRVGRLKTLSEYSLDLDTSGLYSWVRHPQALALSLVVVALALLTGSIPLIASLPIWLLCWIGYTYFEEELELVPTFGQQYLAYRERTPRLWPSLEQAREALRKRLSLEGAPSGAGNSESELERDVPHA